MVRRRKTLKASTPPNLAPYAGRWVALVQDRVAGVGVTAEAAKLAAKRCRPKEEPTVFLVPASTAEQQTATRLELEPPDSLVGQACRFLRGQRGAAWLVGGYVRDRLLHRETHDLDVVVPTDAIRKARALADHFGGAFFKLDEERDVGRALLPRERGPLNVDISRLRATDLAGDLALRDFTINAMALDLNEDPPVLIDHHGGLEDSRLGLVRAVSERSFRDDPVRMLRGVRQAADLGFALDEQSVVWIRRDARRLSEIPAERVQPELVRLIDGDAAARHLLLLSDLGLLSVVLPEVAGLQGIGQSQPHYLDVFDHTLESLRQWEWLLSALRGDTECHGSGSTSGAGLRVAAALAPILPQLLSHLAQPTSADRTRGMLLKWALLLHDVGKPKTRTVEEGGRVRFFQHQSVGAEMAATVLRGLRFSSNEVRWISTIVRNHLRPSQLAREPELTRRAVYRFFRDTGEAGVDTCLLSLADHLATWGPGLQSERWSRRVDTTAQLLHVFFTRHKEQVAPDPLLNGWDLQQSFDLPAGPGIGVMLETLREAQASGEVRTRDEALALVQGQLSNELADARGAGSEG